jgi:four helix bundle protein
MDNREFGKQLEIRTKAFAVSIIRLSMKLPRTSEAMVIKNQLTKSGTSVGANYREANRARSKADFKSKIKICESEASETVYWLEIIRDSELLERAVIKKIADEANEILAIFASIGKSL